MVGGDEIQNNLNDQNGNQGGGEKGPDAIWFPDK